MSEHEPATDATDESQRMTPKEVEETRHTPASKADSYPGGDYDGEMADDIEPRIGAQQLAAQRPGRSQKPAAPSRYWILGIRYWRLGIVEYCPIPNI